MKEKKIQPTLSPFHKTRQNLKYEDDEDLRQKKADEGCVNESVKLTSLNRKRKKKNAKNTFLYLSYSLFEFLA